MDRQHHRLSGHESEQTLGDGEGQGGLACCRPRGHRESDTTESATTTQYLFRLFDQTKGSAMSVCYTPSTQSVAPDHSRVSLLLDSFSRKCACSASGRSVCSILCLGGSFLIRKRGPPSRAPRLSPSADLHSGHQEVSTS